jgi:TRAP-type C4-dicarboxylate transport system permease small subunit
MNEKRSLFHTVEKAVTRLSEGLTLLSGLLLLIAVTLTVVSIGGRALISFGFGPVPGDYELVETFIGLAIYSFMPYCQLMRGHVGVDLFVMPFGNRAMNLTQLLGDLVLSGLCLLLTWRHIYGTIDKYHSHETTFILAFPIWWGFAVAIVLLVALCIVCLFTVWRDIRDLTQNNIYSGSVGGH